MDKPILMADKLDIIWDKNEKIVEESRIGSPTSNRGGWWSGKDDAEA